MSVKSRLQKLERKREGKARAYMFEMSDGMDTSTIREEFCKERGIEPNAKDTFIFINSFCKTELKWKFLYASEDRQIIDI